MSEQRILVGDALDKLKELPDNSIHVVCTSPPYFCQRDYGTRRWFDADSTCAHDRSITHEPTHPGQVAQTVASRKISYFNALEGGEQTYDFNRTSAVASGQTAITHSCSKCNGWYGQLGLELTPADFVRHMVDVFEEVRRVLHPSGCVFLNMGDTYATPTIAKRTKGVKVKDLLGVPWMLAFALRDSGWYLRNDCLWHKTPTTPESVRDRPSRVHEYVFMLTKSKTYYFNKGDINDESLYGKRRRVGRTTIWKLPTTVYRGEHFASFNTALPSVAVLTGTSDKGCCSQCMSPYCRVDTTWSPTCDCKAEVIPCVVMDPFAGSGTTLAVAAQLRRSFVGIDLNPDYKSQIETRLAEINDELFQQQLVNDVLDL